MKVIGELPMRKINLFEYKKLKDTEINDLCRRAESDLSDYYPKVDNIIQNVKQNGDVALKKYSFEMAKMGNKNFIGLYQKI